MRILTLIDADRGGGLYSRFRELWAFADRMGHEVCVLAGNPLDFSDAEIRQYVLPRSCSTRERGLLFWISYASFAALRSLRLCQRKGAQKIATFGPFYTALCFLPICLRRARAVTFVRGDNLRQSSNTARNIFFYLVDWLGLLLSEKVVFVSNALERTYRARYRLHSTAILPNKIGGGFALDEQERNTVRNKLLRGDPDEKLIVTVGVLSPGKNLRLLVEALALARSQNSTLVIVGDERPGTGERARLEQLVRERRLEPRVVLLGWQEDPRPFIAAADLFVFPSLREGSPNALLEALACGVACLGSRADGTEEVLLFPDLLFSPESPADLAQRLDQVLNDREEHNRITLLCAERFREYAGDWAEEALRLVVG